MSRNGQGRVTGHVRLRDGKHGAVWYLRYRLPDGRQRQRRLGDAWEGPGRPPDRYYTRRTAREALDETLVKARNGELPEQAAEREARVEAGTFRAAARDFLRFCEQVKRVDDVTLKDYRGVCEGYLIPAFGDRPLEEITDRGVNDYAERLIAEGRLSNRTVCRHLVVAGGIFKRAKVEPNPAAADRVQRPKVVYSGEYRAYEPDEIELLAAQAEDRQDAALYRVAAFTGLRQGELLGLRWCDVDFVTGLLHVRRNWTDRREKVPKGKKVRSVPMAPAVVDELARLKDRGVFAADDDLVFVNTTGGHLDAWALRRRYYRAVKAAGLPRLTFHCLRHTFGSQVIRQLDGYTLQSLMGHQHYSTTQRYLHHKPRPQDAQAIARAFAADGDKARAEDAQKPLPDPNVRGS
jgi:integrase